MCTNLLLIYSSQNMEAIVSTDKHMNKKDVSYIYICISYRSYVYHIYVHTPHTQIPQLRLNVIRIFFQPKFILVIKT